MGSVGAEALVDALAEYPHGLTNGLDSLDLRQTGIEEVTCFGLLEVRPHLKNILALEPRKGSRYPTRLCLRMVLLR